MRGREIRVDEAAEVTARPTEARCGNGDLSEITLLRERLTELGRTDPERSGTDVAECAGVAPVIAHYLGHPATNRVLEPVNRAVSQSEGHPERLAMLLDRIPGIAAEKLTPLSMEELTMSLLRVKGGNHD